MDEEHIGERTLEFNFIDDGIYIGTNLCCQIHFDETLKKEGITADISLEGETVDAPFGVESFLWLPIKDHYPPTHDQLELGVLTIEKLRALNKRIYVHCKNGHGRSPTLVAAYYIKSREMSVDDALALIQEKRPTIHLQDSQIRALEEYSKGK